MIRMRWAAAAVGYVTAIQIAKINDQMGLFRLYVMCSIMATYCDMYNCTPHGRLQSQIASCQKNRERNQRLQPKVAKFHSQHATRNRRLRIQIPILFGCLFLIALRVAVFYFFWLQQKSCIKFFRNPPSLKYSGRALYECAKGGRYRLAWSQGRVHANLRSYCTCRCSTRGWSGKGLQAPDPPE